MLPETGTRNAFKREMLGYCTRPWIPMPGERYEVEDAATIFNSASHMGRKVLTVTHICGDVHFNVDLGAVMPTQCCFFGHKWRRLRESGELKFIGYDQ